MKKSEVIEKLNIIDTTTAEGHFYCPFFDKEIKLIINSYNTSEDKFIYSDYLYECFIDLINLDTSEKEIIMEEVFEDYKSEISFNDYDFVSDELLEKHDWDSEKANLEYFNFNSKEDAYNSILLKYAKLVEYSDKSSTGNSSYFSLFFKRVWDEDNELQITFENGKFKKLN